MVVGGAASGARWCPWVSVVLPDELMMVGGADGGLLVQAGKQGKNKSTRFFDIYALFSYI